MKFEVKMKLLKLDDIRPISDPVEFLAKAFEIIKTRDPSSLARITLIVTKTDGNVSVVANGTSEGALWDISIARDALIRDGGISPL